MAEVVGARARPPREAGRTTQAGLSFFAQPHNGDVVIRQISFDSGAVQHLLAEWNDELGFPPKRGSLVEAGDFAGPDGVFLVAEDDDQRLIGCGGVRRLTATGGEVKRLFVRRAARGRGVGRELLRALEQQAALLRFETLRLDTTGRSAAALALFRAQGYEPIQDYNSNPYARYWFEKQLGPD
jgi:GNAT superfamily N-acetyltransferase